MKNMLKSLYLKWKERQIKVKIKSGVPMERPGTKYGGWLIPKSYLNANSVVYLVGAGEDVSFDVAVAAQYKCPVQIVDPTPRAIKHVDDLKQAIVNGYRMPLANTVSGFYPEYQADVADLLHFHAIGLWDESTVLHFFAPADETHVSHSIVNLQKSNKSIEVPVCRLSELMVRNNHGHIDLLKIDIEGAEYTVLETILLDKIDINVICIEFDESSRNHLDSGYISRIENSLHKLETAGYIIVAKEATCQNYTLVHKRFWE